MLMGQFRPAAFHSYKDATRFCPQSLGDKCVGGGAGGGGGGPSELAELDLEQPHVLSPKSHTHTIHSQGYHEPTHMHAQGQSKRSKK